MAFFLSFSHVIHREIAALQLLPLWAKLTCIDLLLHCILHIDFWFSFVFFADFHSYAAIIRISFPFGFVIFIFYSCNCYGNKMLSNSKFILSTAEYVIHTFCFIAWSSSDTGKIAELENYCSLDFLWAEKMRFNLK